MGSPGVFIHSGTLGGRLSAAPFAPSASLPARPPAMTAPPTNAPPLRRNRRRDVTRISLSMSVGSVIVHPSFPAGSQHVLASASLAARNARGSSASPGRSPNHAAEIAAPESRVLFREHVGLDVAECRVGLVFDAIVERLDNVFLELIGARMRVHDRYTFSVAVFGIGQPQHVHLDAR